MKQPDYLVLVNEEHRLPLDFEQTVELVTVENAVGDRFPVEKKTYEAFLRMKEDLWKEWSHHHSFFLPTRQHQQLNNREPGPSSA